MGTASNRDVHNATASSKVNIASVAVHVNVCVGGRKTIQSFQLPSVDWVDYPLIKTLDTLSYETHCVVRLLKFLYDDAD